MDKLKPDRQGDENDDDPFQYLHAPIARLVGNLLVNALEGFEFAQNAAIPFVEMKTSIYEPVNARQILITQELKRVVDAFEEKRVVDLQFADAT